MPCEIDQLTGRCTMELSRLKGFARVGKGAFPRPCKCVVERDQYSRFLAVRTRVLDSEFREPHKRSARSGNARTVPVAFTCQHVMHQIEVDVKITGLLRDADKS